MAYVNFRKWFLFSLVALLAVVCLVWLFAFRSRPLLAETRVTEHGAESIDSSENISNSLEGRAPACPS